jgi:hypothetical protein
MKPPAAKFAKTPQSPVFQIVTRKPGAKLRVATQIPKSQKSEKRDNIFSKSRDTREDRGMRQMKTSRPPQTGC